MTRQPGLVVAAPFRGPQGLRVAPLLAALGQLVECRFIVTAASERDLVPGQALTMAEWLDATALEPVPHLYILADDPAAAHVLRAAWRRPGVGVVLLQDPGLAVLHQSITLDAGQPEAWVRAMAGALGGPGRRLARAQLAGLFREGQRHWLPMLDGLADAAPLLVARSRHAAGYLPPGTRHAVLSESIPAPTQPDRQQARAALGLGGGPLLLVPLRAPAPLTALHAVAAEAGAALLPCLPDDELAPRIAACDAALGLGLPFGVTPLHPLAAAIAAGRPVLTWEADPAAVMPVRTISFPADAAALAQAIRRLLAVRPLTAGLSEVAREARDLLGIIGLSHRDVGPINF